MVYLLHFDEPYRHARHYVGFAETPATFGRRVAHHRNGTGARLLAVVSAAGIGFTIARTWPDADRTQERKLKNRKNAPRLCPVCAARKAA